MVELIARRKTEDTCPSCKQSNLDVLVLSTSAAEEPGAITTARVCRCGYGLIFNDDLAPNAPPRQVDGDIYGFAFAS